MKDRVTYASQLLYVGPTGVQGQKLAGVPVSGVEPTQLHHINYIEHNTEYDREAPYQLGRRSPVGESIISPIDVELNFQYALADAQNEKWLGFDLSDLSVPCISGFLENHNDCQNFYVLTTQRGDAVKYQTLEEFTEEQGSVVTSFSNGVITNYKIEASIDSIPVASVSVNASAINYDQSVSGIICPTISPDTSCFNNEGMIIPCPKEDNLDVAALRPAYMNLIFSSGESPGGGYLLYTGEAREDGQSSCSLTSFEVDLELPRRINKRLGAKFPISKPIQYPAQLNFSCEARVKDLISGNMLESFCSQGTNLTISMLNPYNQKGNVEIMLKDLHLDSQISQLSLRNQEYVSLSFSSPLGAAQDWEGGLYISGVAEAKRPTTYGITSGQLSQGKGSYK